METQPKTLQQLSPYLQCLSEVNAMTTVTFRVEEEIKQQANEIFESLGMNFSQAINLFLMQTIIQGRFPCLLESKEKLDGCPKEILSLFGSGEGIEFEQIADPIPEPEDFEL